MTVKFNLIKLVDVLILGAIIFYMLSLITNLKADHRALSDSFNSYVERHDCKE